MKLKEFKMGYYAGNKWYSQRNDIAKVYNILFYQRPKVMGSITNIEATNNLIYDRPIFELSCYDDNQEF